MSHLDEGTLHALLDGELETTEVAEIQAHLGSCSACGLRLREVKEFLAEADRLVASVELGKQAVAAAPAAAPRESARPEPIARPEPPTRREPATRPLPAEAPGREPWNEPPPTLLIPDNESAADRRARRMQRFGWAALFLGMVGAGFLGVKMRPNQPGLVPIAGRATAAESDAVVSPEEAARRDEAAAAPESSTRALSKRPAEAKSKPAAPANTSGTRADRELALQKRTQPVAPQPAAATAPTLAESADAETIDSVAQTVDDTQEADSAAAEDITTVRARAAEALADLDRERRRDRAAAATAALDAERRRPAATNRPAPASNSVVAGAAAPAPTPPAPPTLEQRSQVYQRIGLDEAANRLGGPAHVIEGLSPMFMGVVRGSAILGADPKRDVVRVVYQDSQGRLILLDQQRLAAGQTPPRASPLSWLIGQTAMWLNGEASGEILRTYRPRVR